MGMMKTTMMLANMMEGTVAKTPRKTGITTVRIVCVCVKEKNIGSRMITVMMKTTMLLATSMVVIVVIIPLQIGICTAKTASALLEHPMSQLRKEHVEINKFAQISIIGI